MTFDSKFTPDCRACIPSEEKRIAYGTESFHAHFKDQFYISHPIIFHIKRAVSSCYDFQLP